MCSTGCMGGAHCAHSQCIARKLASDCLCTGFDCAYAQSVTPNGTAIRAIRTMRSLRLADLAHSTGLSTSYLSRLERGEAGASDSTIRDIADGLAVPPADITRGADMASQPRQVPFPGTPEGEVFHYTPEEAAEFLPWSPRVLRMKAQQYAVPHNRGGGRITFTARDIREISDMTAVRPLPERAAA
ncbi:helix-turn-helix domain-containing protein [Streptomyces sp. 3MP-14]|uniref:Helix-turn-helix domain-containing protein n=1 Tax=Streptomyces mimosae TaxID=2586635 RepID=A0A5N6A3D5_9ACTN|nr:MULTISPECIES: helix-turn-helix transcriptional regulator [Streptomyces]KAB8162955.1 helix-turn-helix domain-containing protein [Streptomyces mimosae]KAB8179169.1 helix-turn-helix domain-containing protein [Streptomyces sp. 3MP-14]